MSGHSLPPKSLWLLRHGQAELATSSSGDHERRLSPRGRRDATAVGACLRQSGALPVLVLCSGAVRTVETLELLALGDRAEVMVEEALYGASTSELIDRLRGVSETVSSVLVIGHNPTIGELAQMLSGEAGNVVQRYPTAALSELECRIVTWGALGPGSATLRRFLVPDQQHGGRLVVTLPPG
jgi:phosphohistidine phosphatase